MLVGLSDREQAEMDKPLVRAHPEARRIRDAMERCVALAGNYQGKVYRVAGLRWCTPEYLLSGGGPTGGAMKDGGRWNARGRATGLPRPSTIPPHRWLLVEGFRAAYSATAAKTA